MRRFGRDSLTAPLDGDERQRHRRDNVLCCIPQSKLVCLLFALSLRLTVTAPFGTVLSNPGERLPRAGFISAWQPAAVASQHTGGGNLLPLQLRVVSRKDCMPTCPSEQPKSSRFPILCMAAHGRRDSDKRGRLRRAEPDREGTKREGNTKLVDATTVENSATRSTAPSLDREGKEADRAKGRASRHNESAGKAARKSQKLVSVTRTTEGRRKRPRGGRLGERERLREEADRKYAKLREEKARDARVAGEGGPLRNASAVLRSEGPWALTHGLMPSPEMPELRQPQPSTHQEAGGLWGRWEKPKGDGDGGGDGGGGRVGVRKVSICVIPPAEVWGEIQEIRKEHDRHYGRWMPHINLIYPLAVHEDDMARLPDAIAGAVDALMPFSVDLDGFGYFQHPVSCMLYAKASPRSSEDLVRLQERLVQRLGAGGGSVSLSEDEGEQTGVANRSFTPHLCLGQWRNESEVQAAMEHMLGGWKRTRWEVDRVYVVDSDADAVLGVRSSVSLGASSRHQPSQALASPPVDRDHHTSPPSIADASPARNASTGGGRDGERTVSERRAASKWQRNAESGADVARVDLQVDPTDGAWGETETGGWVWVDESASAELDDDDDDDDDDAEGRAAVGRLVLGMDYADTFAPARQTSLPRFQRPRALNAPALYAVGEKPRPTTFADLGELTVVTMRRRAPLEELLVEHATMSLHGMKSRLQPLAARILAAGTESERDGLRELLATRKATVALREEQLQQSKCFNRKVAKAVGAMRGEVSLLQVREQTWDQVIVQAKREFKVNKLRLEAFQSGEQQARAWCRSLARDVTQTVTLMSREQVQELLGTPEQWGRVKDVLTCQGNLRYPYSLLSVLERADLEASDPLALEYVMAVSDFAFTNRAAWDNHLNAARTGSEFRMDVVEGVPGYYVYYDLYGWC